MERVGCAWDLWVPTLHLHLLVCGISHLIGARHSTHGAPGRRERLGVGRVLPRAAACRGLLRPAAYSRTVDLYPMA
eukprot:7121525-Prymnesium_polylepis.1